MDAKPSLKLHWSPRSPFVRKVMVAAHEAGRAADIELIRNTVAITMLSDAVMSDNPLNKIPTLILADGSPLHDSRVICEYLDHMGGRPRLLPPPGPARWQALRWQALADGLVEALVLWRNERERKPEVRSQDHMDAYRIKAGKTLDRFESEAADIAAAPFSMAHIALGCALGYLDFRFDELKWRQGRPTLEAWGRTFAARPSAIATSPIDDS